MDGYSVSRVVNVGGFYVSRFLIGKDSDGSLVSKSGIDVRNRNNSSTRAGHISSLRSFINTSYAKTSLISGIAYDSMMNFVNNKSYSKGIFNVNTEYAAVNSTITGNSENAKVCNIYDLITTPGGGLLTSETLSASAMNWGMVVRGYTYNTGKTECPSYRAYGGNNSGVGFSSVRATLYVYN